MQRKTQCLRQNLVAKAAKEETGKLSQKAQLFAVLCLCKEKRSFFDKPRLQRLPKRSSVPQTKALCHKQSSVSQKTAFGTYKALTSQKPQAKAPDRRYQRRKRIPRRKPANYRKKRSFLQFCAFAEKNAVSLTNQGCKGCQNEALRYKARHRGSRDALAAIKP